MSVHLPQCLKCHPARPPSTLRRSRRWPRRRRVRNWRPVLAGKTCWWVPMWLGARCFGQRLECREPWWRWHLVSLWRCWHSSTSAVTTDTSDESHADTVTCQLDQMTPTTSLMACTCKLHLCSTITVTGLPLFRENLENLDRSVNSSEWVCEWVEFKIPPMQFGSFWRRKGIGRGKRLGESKTGKSCGKVVRFVLSGKIRIFPEIINVITFCFPYCDAQSLLDQVGNLFHL